jgi:hypothetical protein
VLPPWSFGRSALATALAIPAAGIPICPAVPTLISSPDTPEYISHGSATIGWHHYDGGWVFLTERPCGTTAEGTCRMSRIREPAAP